jgi:hypothetical protein
MMLRSVAIAFAIALGTVLGSGSANATLTVFGSLSYGLLNVECPPPGGCIAELNPSNPKVDVNLTAGPGMNVDVTNGVEFSLDLSNPANVALAFVDLHVEYSFLKGLSLCVRWFN